MPGGGGRSRRSACGTQSDQECSDTLLYPLSAWAFYRRFPRTMGAFPRNEEAFRGRLGGVTRAFSRNEGIELTFRDCLVRMVVAIFETHCIEHIRNALSRTKEYLTVINIAKSIFSLFE